MGSVNRHLRMPPKARITPFNPATTGQTGVGELGRGPTKWIVIEPDLLPGEDIVVVMDPAHLAEAEKENPGLVTYLLSEIDVMKPFEQDFDFRRKIHLAKKLFGGFVRPIDQQMMSTL